MARKQRPTPLSDPRAARLLPANPGWRWRTLPVWLTLTGGFLIGYYIASLGAGVRPDRWAYFIQLAVLLGFAAGLSRITRWLTERFVVRRRGKATATPAAPAAAGLSREEIRARRQARRRGGRPGAGGGSSPSADQPPRSPR